MLSWVRNRLAEPSSRGLDLDDPGLTLARREILLRKPFLRAIYHEWYDLLKSCVPPIPGAILEIGSGAGFLRERMPQVIQSDVFWLPHLQLVLNGCSLPFVPGSIKAVIMTDVLHHLPQVRDFFKETVRCLTAGGVIAMVEPWNTLWSGFVYQHLHQEPFLPSAKTWEFETSGPLSGANGALPWILFSRDRLQFEKEFPELRVEMVQPMMPFRYLLSGGISMRSLAPFWSFRPMKNLEKRLYPWNHRLAMFAMIVLKKL